MTEAEAYPWLLRGLFVVAAVTFPALFVIKAPYGRHAGESRFPTLPARLGWIVMEAPSAFVPLACWLLGDHRTDPARLALLALWEVHYLHRTLVFPFRLAPGAKPMPLPIPALGFTFTAVNGYVNGRWLFTMAPADAYGASWLVDPRFLFGAALFFAGLTVNRHADRVLLALRRPGETGYKIPHGGLYRLVSCPNYLGEIVEWTGWAVASWSLPGLMFAVWTVANLVPRAWAHHRWYRETFPDYPKERRAVVPFLL